MFTHLIPESAKKEEKETPKLYTKQSFENSCTGFTKINPNPEEVLFCKIVRNADNRHVIFVCSIMENTQAAFLVVDKKIIKQDTFPTKIGLVLQIPFADFRVEMIKQWYV